MSHGKGRPNKQGKTASLVLRLNSRLFLRLLGIFLCMDVLLAVLITGGLFLWGESRAAGVAVLVSERGVPSEETLLWMEASDYTITPLDRDPDHEPRRMRIFVYEQLLQHQRRHGTDGCGDPDPGFRQAAGDDSGRGGNGKRTDCPFPLSAQLPGQQTVCGGQL